MIIKPALSHKAGFLLLGFSEVLSIQVLTVIDGRFQRQLVGVFKIGADRQASGGTGQFQIGELPKDFRQI